MAPFEAGVVCLDGNDRKQSIRHPETADRQLPQ